MLSAASGSRVGFAGDAPVEGSDEHAQDVHEDRGARVQDGRLRLRGRWDGLFSGARQRAQRASSSCASGAGAGARSTSGSGASGASVRWADVPDERPLPRAPSVRRTRRSGGPDILVGLGKDAGEADLDWVALVPPTEPDNVIRSSSPNQ